MQTLIIIDIGYLINISFLITNHNYLFHLDFDSTTFSGNILVN